MNLRATVTRLKVGRECKCDCSFSSRRIPMKSIFFLIAAKATVNWKHMVKNCPRIRSKFKSLFYKGEKIFLQLEARRREVSRRTKGKRKHSKEYFQKKILTSRRNESLKREYRSPYKFQRRNFKFFDNSCE